MMLERMFIVAVFVSPIFAIYGWPKLRRALRKSTKAPSTHWCDHDWSQWGKPETYAAELYQRRICHKCAFQVQQKIGIATRPLGPTNAELLRAVRKRN